jgi:GTP:adenosylcobinamide-phosphate guanylyltransferase
MSIILLDGSLMVDITYEELDSDFVDNIQVSIHEDCPDDERLFRAEETNIFLTPDQACELARRLSLAAQCSIQN